MSDDFVEGATVESDPFDADALQTAQREIQERHEKQVERVQATVRSLQEAYRRVFAGMASPGDVQLVVSDLEAFCRADMSTYHDNPRIHCLLSGRQEVILRIRDYTRLDFDTLWTKLNQPPTG